VATVLFAVGLRETLDRTQRSLTFEGRVQVQVTREPVYPDASLMATVDAQPDTARVVRTAGFSVAVPGAGPTFCQAFLGDSPSLGYLLISGRWFHGTGEVVAPKALLQDAHLRVGDTFTGSAGGQPLRLHIVGEVYNLNNLGHSLLTDWSTYEQVKPDASPGAYYITLKPGADAAAYARRVAATEPDFLSVQQTQTDLVGPIQIIDSVTLVLAIVLLLIAVAGVFNTVLLNTRERIRDTAVLKALGMTPGQVLAMVVTSAAVLGIAGGILGVPVGVAIHHVLTTSLQGATGNDVPPQTLNVFTPLQLVGAPIAALLVAMLAAALPARWAARAPVVAILHSE
jgi:putative ABC transport system permease protein